MNPDIIAYGLLIFGALALVSSVILPFISGPKSDLQILRENSEYDRARTRYKR